MQDERFEQLVQGYVDGRLSQAEVEELDERLRSEPEARRHFWGVARLHGELRVWGERAVAHRQLGATVAQMGEAEEEVEKGKRRKVVGWGIGWRGMGRMVAVFALGALLSWAGRDVNWKGSSLEVRPAAPERTLEAAGLLGRMVVEGGAVYAAGLGPGPGGEMRAGVYEMLEGSAHVRLVNGVDLTLQAPVRLALHNLLRVTLERGVLRALVPESAHGFTVGAPDAEFEDMGTEFGVEVDGGGRSVMRVFDGEVRVKSGRNTARTESVKVGESVVVEPQGVRPVEALPETVFPSTDGVAYQRWRTQSAQRRKDTGLVFYYDFEPDARDGGRLVDVARAGRGLDARIVGAQWVSGRWAGKRGLQFENPGEGVWISVPGEYAELTLAGWVRIDRLEAPLNALLNTNGWFTGGLHWQINRSGRLTSSGVFWGRQEHRGPAVSVPLGRWAHVAMVLDAQAQEIRHYVDGELAGGRWIEQPGYRASFEKACIGRLEEWLPGDTRELRGRMDELAMWNRALRQEEVKRLVEEGAVGVQGRVLARGRFEER